jgi:hypothetical protein
VHRPHRRRQRTEAGVLEGLTRIELRELADDARPLDALDVAVAVGDDPLPADELRRLLADIGDADVIGEGLGFAVALVGEILALDLDANPAGGGVGHDGSV